MDPGGVPWPECQAPGTVHPKPRPVSGHSGGPPPCSDGDWSRRVMIWDRNSGSESPGRITVTVTDSNNLDASTGRTGGRLQISHSQ